MNRIDLAGRRPASASFCLALGVLASMAGFACSAATTPAATAETQSALTTDTDVDAATACLTAYATCVSDGGTTCRADFDTCWDGIQTTTTTTAGEDCNKGKRRRDGGAPADAVTRSTAAPVTCLEAVDTCVRGAKRCEACVAPAVSCVTASDDPDDATEDAGTSAAILR